MAAEKSAGKILILATKSCAYPGADAVGQGHQSYPANTYILRVKAPVLFPEHFYLDCFDKGIAGIIIMSCGVECPYEGAYEALAKRIDRVYVLMKARGLDIRRLRLTAICTVCTRAFIKEVNQMNDLISEFGPARPRPTGGQRRLRLCQATPDGALRSYRNGGKTKFTIRRPRPGRIAGLEAALESPTRIFRWLSLKRRLHRRQDDQALPRSFPTWIAPVVSPPQKWRPRPIVPTLPCSRTASCSPWCARATIYHAVVRQKSRYVDEGECIRLPPVRISVSRAGAGCRARRVCGPESHFYSLLQRNSPEGPDRPG